MLPSKQHLSHLLGSLYDAAADPILWTPFLGELARSTGATSAALLMHDIKQRVSTISSSWQLNPESIRLYQEHYYALDVWTPASSGKPVGTICNSEMLFPLHELKTKEIYNDFLAPDGVEHAMFALLENSSPRVAAISLYRNKSRTEFATTDLQLLEFLVPHLQRASKQHLHFSALKNKVDGLETALTMLGTGIIFLGMGGEIIFMNRSATATVDSKDGLLATRHGLRAERQPESEQLAKAILEATSASNGLRLYAGSVFVSRRSRPTLQITISPFRGKSIDLSQPIKAVAFIVDPSQRQRPAQDVLRTLFRLTPAECRVALLLGDGRSPREISQMVGVSFSTVRTQIRSIFSKTNVRRQGELIRLLLSNSALSIQPNN